VTLRVERATRSAIDELVRRYADPNAPESSHEARWRMQEAGEGVYLLAWVEALPVGWALVRWNASEQAGGAHVAELEGLDVVAEHQRRGAGSLLLEEALRLAREAGFDGLGLKVTVANPWNDAARRLYERHGFEDSGAAAFEDGYWYWTDDGARHWDGEQHRYLVKRF
jgi:GNAT superfamily N-acetyltransferase